MNVEISTQLSSLEIVRNFFADLVDTDHKVECFYSGKIKKVGAIDSASFSGDQLAFRVCGFIYAGAFGRNWVLEIYSPTGIVLSYNRDNATESSFTILVTPAADENLKFEALR